MTEAVIDQLEIIEVNDQHRECICTLRHRVPYPIKQKLAIWEPCHLIVLGEIFEIAGSSAHGAAQGVHPRREPAAGEHEQDRKSTRLNSSHHSISYAVF